MASSARSLRDLEADPAPRRIRTFHWSVSVRESAHAMVCCRDRCRGGIARDVPRAGRRLVRGPRSARASSVYVRSATARVATHWERPWRYQQQRSSLYSSHGDGSTSKAADTDHSADRFKPSTSRLITDPAADRFDRRQHQVRASRMRVFIRRQGVTSSHDATVLAVAPC